MNARRISSAVVAAAAAFMVLTGCDPATTSASGSAGTSGCDPHGMPIFGGCPDGGSPPAPVADASSGDVSTSPFCQPGSIGTACVPLGPIVPNANYTVTRKYHNDASGMWCVESRVLGDPHQLFDRTCIPDSDTSAADRQWLASQHVGNRVWQGGAS